MLAYRYDEMFVSRRAENDASRVGKIRLFEDYPRRPGDNTFRAVLEGNYPSLPAHSRFNACMRQLAQR